MVLKSFKNPGSDWKSAASGRRLVNPVQPPFRHLQTQKLHTKWFVSHGKKSVSHGKWSVLRGKWSVMHAQWSV